jgi:fatty acid desaturase
LDAVTIPADYQELAIQIREAGLLNRRAGYYGIKIGLTVAAFGAGWAALLVIGRSWAVLGIAAFLGIMSTQLGFVCHDAGHQQVFRSRRANWLLGLAIGNALMGLSFSWWMCKHSAHHAHPNQVGRDPDIGDGLVGNNRSARLLSRWQAGLFFPLMVLRSSGLYTSGIQKLVRQRDRAAAGEGLLIALYVAVYLTVIAWLLSPLQAVAFIIVQQAVFSVYLGCSFAPNHKGMPLIEGDPVMSFVRRQVITARNVSGCWFTDLVLGGLNYQIEHHLFPTMPRPNLRRAQSIVRPFCIANGFGYCEETLVGSFRQALQHLRTQAATTPLASGLAASN